MLSAARRVASMGDLARPGDYFGPATGWTGDKASVFFLLPTADPADPRRQDGAAGGVHHVTTPPHTFRECPDGSLEIRASIGAHPTYADGVRHSDQPHVWHGYLDEGNTWRQE